MVVKFDRNNIQNTFRRLLSISGQDSPFPVNKTELESTVYLTEVLRSFIQSEKEEMKNSKEMLLSVVGFCLVA